MDQFVVLLGNIDERPQMISIVGTTNHLVWNEFCRKLIEDLAPPSVIVSGFAYGVRYCSAPAGDGI
jgi:predicted Rossmann fold nucleotide-binding protein DprA/Smf involved in DNA uptake